MENRFQIKYLPGLDGLRAIAVIWVVLAHSVPAGFSGGGRVGVSAFFVLSGFLITSLLLRNYQTHNRINFSHFFIRRLLRLVPALIFVGAFFYVLYYSFCRYDLYNVEFTFYSFVHTIPFVKYILFNTQRDIPAAYAHYWTLIIEAQYYLVWPVILSVLLRHFNNKKLLLLSGLWAFLLLINAGWGLLDPYEKFMHYSLSKLADEDVKYISRELSRFISPDMLLGSILAITINNDKSHIAIRKFINRKYFSYIAALSLLFLIYFVTETESNNSVTGYVGYALFSSLSIVLILSQLSDRSILDVILRNKFVIYLGTISYGIYLTHYPISLWMRETFTPAYSFIFTLITSVLLSSVSYHLIEVRFLRIKKYFSI